jgi:polar amino acid transport system permease protein
MPASRASARVSGMRRTHRDESIPDAGLRRSAASGFNSSPIVLAAAIYLVMLWPVMRLISRLERRIAA